MLRARGVEFDAIEYLKNPLDRATLERLMAIVDAEPADMVRKDRRFSELGLDPAQYISASHVVTLLLDHPELMQRPIVAVGDRAVIARPPERALALLETR